MVAPLGTKTLLDLKTFIKRTFGDESGVQIVDDDITAWANSGVMEIVSKLPILESVASSTTIIGVDNYALPLNIIEMKGVQVGTRMLKRVDFSEIKSFQTNDSVGYSGQPYYWYTFSNNVYVYPAPNAAVALNLFYNSTPMVVVTDTDKLGIPDRYYDRLCEYVLARAYELDENPSMMTSKLNYFEQKLKEMTGDDQQNSGEFAVVTEYQYGYDRWDYSAW